MKKGICLLSILPVRKEASEMSELVTQVLFGDTLNLLDETVKWIYVRLDSDNYEGWVDRKMVQLISDSKSEEIRQLNSVVLSQVVTKLYSESQQSNLWLPAGSIIRGLQGDEKSFTLNGDNYVFETKPISFVEPERINIIETAQQFLNAPYLWGGKTFFGMDCSGFTQLVMRINGIKISRDAKQQVEEGNSLSFITESKPGDLAFFDNEDGEITHTGIIIDKNTIIHASGMVRIDRFDHQGIFNKQLSQYTHKLRLIKTYI